MSFYVEKARAKARSFGGPANENTNPMCQEVFAACDEIERLRAELRKFEGKLVLSLDSAGRSDLLIALRRACAPGDEVPASLKSLKRFLEQMSINSPPIAQERPDDLRQLMADLEREKEECARLREELRAKTEEAADFSVQAVELTMSLTVAESKLARALVLDEEERILVLKMIQVRPGEYYDKPCDCGHDAEEFRIKERRERIATKLRALGEKKD